MKRAGEHVRERDNLRRIMAGIGSLCQDCDSRAYRIEWDGQRYRIVVFHPGHCPVRRSAWSASAADDYLADVLRAHGYQIADYLDRPALHRAL